MRASSVFIAGLVGLSSVLVGVGISATAAPTDKVYVCKYTGTPGSGEEVLQGLNAVNTHTNREFPENPTFPIQWGDAQDSSVAIGWAGGDNPVLTESDCVPRPTFDPVVVGSDSLSGCAVRHPATDVLLGAGEVTWDLVRHDTAVWNAVTKSWDRVPGVPVIENVVFVAWTEQERRANGCEQRPAMPTYDATTVAESASGCAVLHPVTQAVLGAGVVTWNEVFQDTAVWDEASWQWDRVADTTATVEDVVFVAWTEQERRANGCEQPPAMPTYDLRVVANEAAGCAVLDPRDGTTLLGSGEATWNLVHADTPEWDADSWTWVRVPDAAPVVADVAFTAWSDEELVANGCEPVTGGPVKTPDDEDPAAGDGDEPTAGGGGDVVVLAPVAAPVAPAVPQAAPSVAPAVPTAVDSGVEGVRMATRAEVRPLFAAALVLAGAALWMLRRRPTA